MLKQFSKLLSSIDILSKNESILIAISGGSDSVVLTHLLHALNYKFELAHCNFQLRGKESAADEAFCRNLAKKLKVKIHVQHFDIQSYCDSKKISVQMAARDLRYAWFEELMKKHHYQALFTAHHANDSVESILLNLIRGASVKGLTGIQVKNGKIIRPLLNFTKSQITEYAKQNKIKYRNDRSNDEDKYKRNFVRLNIIPQIKKLNPAFEETLLRNAQNIRDDINLLEEYLELKKQHLVKENQGEYKIERKKLMKEKNAMALAKHFLLDFGFNTTQLENLMNGLASKTVSGKAFTSKTHLVIVGINEITVVQKTKSNPLFKSFNSIEELISSTFFNGEIINKFSIPHKSELIVNTKQLQFPLILRNRKTGDKFQPYGMKGFKLLSDYYKEQKLNALQKQKVQILVNGNGEIIWVVGYRSDDRYKVDAKTKQILKLKSLGN